MVFRGPSSRSFLLTFLTLCQAIACSTQAPAPTPKSTPAPVPAPAPESTRESPLKAMGLYVLPLQTDGTLQSSAAMLDGQILSSLSTLPEYNALGPEDINAMAQVQLMKDTLGCDGTATMCSAQLANALGAPRLLFGELVADQHSATLTLTLLNTQTQQVLERSTIRGTRQRADLAAMTAKALGEVFDVTFDAPEKVQVQATGSYAEYTEYMMQFGKLMQRQEMNALLVLTKELEGTHVESPPGGTSFTEIMIYYRALACHRLRRRACFDKAAATYREHYADGMYLQGVDSLADAFESEAIRYEDARLEIQERLDSLAKTESKGYLNAYDAGFNRGHLYLAAGQFDQAQEVFATAAEAAEEALLNAQDPKAVREMEDKYMAIIQGWVRALEFDGEMSAAITLLEKVQEKYSRAFRRAHLHTVLKLLPR